MFISLEGIEGSGKSTLSRGLGERLRKEGRTVCLTREPGGSELGKKVRALLLDSTQQVEPRAELFLFLADRAQHVAQVIRPALLAGQIVICDRYIDSTLVYQGLGRNLHTGDISLRALNHLAVDALWPDLTLVLDIDVPTGLSRARGRLQASGATQREGRFEAENDRFHEIVRQGFLQAAQAEPQRFHVVDATRKPEELVEETLRLVRAHPVFGSTT